MKRKADERNINFSVLLVSSKFEILYDYLNDHNVIISSQYHRLVENLMVLKKEFAKFFDENRIQYFDSEPFIKTAIKQNKIVYQDTLDGHPVEAGYEAYAEAAYQGLFNNQKDMKAGRQ